MSNIQHLNDILLEAARALSSAVGSAVKLDQPQVLSDEGRSYFVVRARSKYDDGRIQSVIVKATQSPTYDPNSKNALDSPGLVREWVAAANLAERAHRREHGARLLAGVVERGILIFEDFGANVGSLADALLNGNADEAECALTSYALSLARLHSDTLGCSDGHHEVFKSIFGANHTRRPPGRRVERMADGIANRIGGQAPASEIAEISGRVAEPGRWLSLVHGDPCPDNALIVAGQVRLIDYEYARPTHALLDAIYWKMGFPMCRCAGRLPAEVASRIDAVYRTEIGRTLPLALDDKVYRTELAYTSAAWLFICLGWQLDAALKSDIRWGIATIRSRLLWYLNTAIDLTEAARILPGIRATAEVWRTDLRQRWPDSELLGLYPAWASGKL
jgi:hypothetical protein